MKKWKSVLAFLLSIILAYSLTIPVFAGEMIGNLIKNPGFEDGLDNWEIRAYTNNYSVKTAMRLPDTGNYGRKSLEVLSSDRIPVSIFQEVTLPVSGEYQLSLFGKYNSGLKPTDGGKIAVELESKGESFSYTHPGDEDPNFDFSLTFSVAKSTTIKISLTTVFTTGIFDNVFLKRIGASPDVTKGPNLLQNGSFEDKLDGWTQIGSENAFTTDSIALSGNNSLYMSYFTNKAFEHKIQQTVNVSEGKKQFYDLFTYVKINQWEGSSIIMFLTARDKNNNFLLQSFDILIPSSAIGWEKLSLMLEAPENTASLTVQLYAVAGKGSFYVDDMYLYKVV